MTWNTSGGEDGYSRAEYLQYKNQGDLVPDFSVPKDCVGLIQYFNSVRSFAGVIDNPITMATIDDWQRHTDVILERWERECLFAMDRALRRSYSNVLKFHAERKQINNDASKDRDWKRANG